MTDQKEQKQPEDPQYLSSMIGQRLRRFRESQHLELGQLTACLGVPVEIIEEIEQGKLFLSTEWLLKLSEGLGVNPTWLLTGSEHMMKRTSLGCQDLLKHMQVPVVAETIMADLPRFKIIFCEKLGKRK